MPRSTSRSSPRPSVRSPGRSPVRGRVGSRVGPVGRSTQRYRWRLVLWRVRFLVAATLLGVAAALVVAEIRPAPAWTLPVVVAAHDLGPGTALGPRDVRVVHLAGGLVPGGAHPRTDDVVGHTLAVTVPAGLPIVDALLVGERLAGAGPPGTVVAPVRLADPAVAELLRPGDRIDLLASASTAAGEPIARELAERALVLAAPGPPVREDGAAGGLLGAGSESASGALTLVAVTPTEAAALAGSAGWASLSAVLVK